MPPRSESEPLDSADRRMRSLLLSGANRAYGPIRSHDDYGPDDETEV